MAEPSQMTPEQALSALLDDVARRVAVEIRTHVPGTIVSFSRATGRAEASVRVDMRARLRNGQTFPVGQVDRAPVLWPAGGGFCMDADLRPGDEVMLVVFDRDITEWLDNGGPADPVTGQLHAITNAAVLAVSLRSRPKVGPADPGVGSLLVGAENGQAPWLRLKTLPTPSVVIEAPGIELGNGATLGVARQTDPVSVSTVPIDPWLIWFTQLTAVANGILGPGAVVLPTTPIARISAASAVTRSK